MSGGVGLPAPKALLTNFSTHDVDEAVKSSKCAQPSIALYRFRWDDSCSGKPGVNSLASQSHGLARSAARTVAH